MNNSTSSLLSGKQTAPDVSMAFVISVAVVSMIFWGGTPSATRYAINSFDPVMAAVMRTIVAAALSLPLIVLARLPSPTGFRQWKLAAISGICCFALFPMVLGFGLNRTSTSHAALIIAMGPIATGLIAAGLERTIPGKSWWGGTAIAVTGVVLLVTESNISISPVEQKAGDVIGDLLCVAGMCIAAVGYITGGRLSAQHNAFGVVCWSMLIAGTAMLPLLIVRGVAYDWEMVSMRSWGGVLYLALVSSIIGYAGFFWALDKGGVMLISPIQFIVPIAGVIFGCLLFNESFTLLMTVSAMAIIGGIAFARRT